MTKKKQNHSSIAEDLIPSLSFAGAGIGASILGGSLQSHIPAGMSNPLTTTGSVMGRFMGPVATLGAMNVVTKQLKRLEGRMK